MQPTLDPLKNKGKSPELTEGRPINPPGIYKHKDTGGVYITAEGEAGVVQADALMSPIWKDAWEWVGEVPNRIELLAMRKKQAIDDARAEAAQKKADEAELKAAIEGTDELPEGGETYDPKTEAPAKAAAKK